MAGKITEKELHNSLKTIIDNKAEQSMVNELSSQLEQIAYRVGLSPKDYGAKNVIEDSSFDNSDIIQNLINTISSFEKGGSIIIDDVYGTSKTIELKPKVSIITNSQQGFFNGMLYNSSENLNINTPRLKAISVIDGSMLIYKNTNGERRHVSSYIKNLILDCNKKAKHGFSIVGKDGARQEDNLIIENLSIQGATSHGMINIETLTNRMYNLNISACGGYGIYNSYGVCDSVLVNPYIHTNQQGGIYFGQGCAYYQVQGGKVEDNYANGIDGYACTDIVIDGTQFHANNGYAIKADGLNTEIYFKNGLSGNPNLSSSTNKTHFYVSNGAILTIESNVIKEGKYVCNKSNGGKFFIKNNDILGDLSYCADFENTNPCVVGNILNNAKEKINNGSMCKKVTTEVSTTKSLTFSNYINTSRLGSAYYGQMNYLVVVSSAVNPTQNTIKRYVGLLVVGKQDTTYTCNIVSLIDSNDTGFISSVSATLSGKDIVISVTTGSTIGNVSGYKDIYVNLVDIGSNSFNSIY